MTAKVTIGRVALLGALAAASMAHVGSPDTFFTGEAGPYPVRVTVRLPGVIPGLAQINVRLPETRADSGTRVTVQAIQWNVGPEGAPPPDEARPVPGEPELFASELWFMAPTSYRVHVVVSGPRGQGSAVVPVLALATAQREMPRRMGVMLSALGVFLAAGLLTIVGAAVRESVVPPGETPAPARRRRSRIAVAITATALILIVAGGRAWWNAEALAYGESVLYRPFTSDASVREDGARRVLTLTINDRRWPPSPGGLTRYNALMPDHGKLMHMFLVKETDLDAFAHLHPVPRDGTAAFEIDLPPLPAGRYHVFGDIVHESGYAQTLVAKVDVSGLRATLSRRTADADDAWFVGAAVPESASATLHLSGGRSIGWQRGPAPIVAGVERLLRFTARDASGVPLALEPYMGMLGHVAVARREGDVFAHLHPSGSVSMAALQKFSSAAGPHALHRAMSAAGEVSTLYAFPRPGRYRVWVQMKTGGEVITGAFDATVN